MTTDTPLSQVVAMVASIEGAQDGDTIRVADQAYAEAGQLVTGDKKLTFEFGEP